MTADDQPPSDKKGDDDQSTANSSGQNQAIKTEAQEGSLSQKLPAFWPTMPDLWFVRIESTFRSAKITADQARFDYILPALPEAVMLSVADILRNPPKTEKYKTLKDALIERNSESQEKKLEKLLNYIDIGDEKPSSFFRSMAAQTTSLNVSEELIKKIWLQRLPNHVKGVLSVVEDQDTSKLMTLADKVWEQTRPAQIFDAASKLQPKPRSEPKTIEMQISLVTSQIEELTKKFNNFASYNNRSRSRSRSRRPNQSGSSSSTNDTKKDGLCFYHYRFGNKARKCVEPCTLFKKADPKN